MELLYNEIKNIINIFNIENNKLCIKKTIIPKQPQEKYYGNREYKYKITDISKNKLDKRATQCLFRLYEGSGKAVYLLGVDDKGNVLGLNKYDLILTLKNIISIIKLVKAKIKTINIYNISSLDTYCVVIRIYKDDLELNYI
jgi:GTPase